MTLVIKSTSSDDTERLGSLLGARLKGGEVIELVSDLGGGKTTFVRGLATGAGSKDTASSPSFTLSKVYKTKNFDIYHFDFYRLNEPGIMEHELSEMLSDDTAVIVIEWGEVVEHMLPEKRLTIKIDKTDDSERKLTYFHPPELAYLVEEK